MNLANTYNKLPVSVKKKIVNWYRFLPSSKKTVIKEIDGVTYKLDLSRLVHAQMYHYGVWEPGTTAIIKKYVKPGMSVFDIGASSGVHALRMAKLVGQRGTVYAFEPSDWMFDKLIDNLNLNDFTNVIVEKVALSNECGNEQFESTEHGKLGRGIDEPMIDITHLTIDEYVSQMNVKKLDFIKIDTDGYEVKIFDGARKTLEKFHPTMIVEFRPSLAQGIIDILLEYGYYFFSEKTLKQYEYEELICEVDKEVINVLCRCTS